MVSEIKINWFYATCWGQLSPDETWMTKYKLRSNKQRWPGKTRKMKKNFYNPKVLEPPYGRVHNYDNYSVTIVLLGFPCCLMAVNICLIHFDLTVIGFWFFLSFFWCGSTKKFMALASRPDKNVPMTSSSFGSVYSSLSKVS